MLKLEPGERIVAITPESFDGPMWSNKVLWVYIEKAPQDQSGSMRWVGLQPEEWSEAGIDPSVFNAAEQLFHHLRKKVEAKCTST